MRYVAQVSSLYPIDLAAILYAGISDGESLFRIFLSDVAELPRDPSVRKYVARAALPTCSWSLDSRKIWRQHHIPLEDIKNFSDFANLLVSVGQSLISANKTQIPDNSIIARCNQLAVAAISRAQRSSQQWQSYWAPFVAGVIEEITEQIVGAQVTVEPYWYFRLGQYGNHVKYRAEHQHALDKLLHFAMKAWPKRLVFVQGGHIEIEPLDGSHSWQRFSALAFDGETIELSDAGREQKVQLQINSNGFPNTRFRGPLELLQLHAFGTIVDLPWYADAQLWWEKNANCTGIEFISPISSTSQNRSSLEISKGGYRLRPTGYSLLEFKSATMLTLIQHKLHTPPISPEDLMDWLELIHRFPPISQKLTKDQHSARVYRNLQENESKKRLSQGNTSESSFLYQPISELNPLLYGRYLIEQLALTALLKEWSSPACPYSAPTTIIQHLERLNWLDSNSMLIPSNIVSDLNTSVRVLQLWLESHGWYFAESNFVQINHAFNTLLLYGKRSLTEKLDGSPAGFGLIMGHLREIIDTYYGFAGFCCGGLFKAHILFPFVLLGPEEYRLEIERILNLRAEAKQLFFHPLLWREE
jgi:hypothetical protein